MSFDTAPDERALTMSPTLNLPLDAATQTFAFIARKGAGKTYGAGKLTEELLAKGVQVVVLDTVGNWYGLRIAADGDGKGFDVPVFGGLRGDLPLNATAGELVADVAVDSGRSLILDLSQFSLADRKRFATAFGERLWRQKKAEAHPSPLMLVIEESQLIIPQFTRAGDDARMVGIYEEIIRLGRNYGIGVTMISQRPQSVNKEVLNQTECLFVLQVNGAQERKALRDWICYRGMDVALVDELPSLPIGTAYVWSPQWLGILEKVKIGKKKTFDASATPKVGDKSVRRSPRPLDLGELEKRMAATIETAKQNDPRELRRQIAELRTQLARPTAPLQPERATWPVLTDDQIKRLEAACSQANAAAKQIVVAMSENTTRFKDAIEKIDAPLAVALNAISKLAQSGGARATRWVTEPSAVPRATVQIRHKDDDEGPRISPRISSTQQRILDALAWLELIGNASPTNLQVGAVALIDSTGGHFSNTVGPLSTSGLIVRGNGSIRLTEKGRALATPPERAATLGAYHDMLRQRVRRAKSARNKTVEMLDAIISRGGAAITAEEIGREVGVDHTGGHFSNTIGPLGTLGLIRRARGLIEPTDILFPKGL